MKGDRTIKEMHIPSMMSSIQKKIQNTVSVSTPSQQRTYSNSKAVQFIIHPSIMSELTTEEKDPSTQQQQLKQQHCITFQDVINASQRIKSIAHKTPVLSSSSINALCDNRQLFFKVEAMQRTGSFKFRSKTYK